MCCLERDRKHNRIAIGPDRVGQQARQVPVPGERVDVQHARELGGGQPWPLLQGRAGGRVRRGSRCGIGASPAA
jgi:hypothetical protein